MVGSPRSAAREAQGKGDQADLKAGEMVEGGTDCEEPLAQREPGKAPRGVDLDQIAVGSNQPIKKHVEKEMWKRLLRSTPDRSIW